MTPALISVDWQADYLKTPDLHPPTDALIHRAAQLLQTFRESALPVIHVWTTVHRDRDHRLPHWREAKRWICVAGTSGHQTPPALRPKEGEAIIHKSGFNPFASGELEEALARIQCDRVFVTGVHLHACVRATVVECLERGYRVCVADDAVGSNDPVHAAATRRWLSQRTVTFASTAALISQLSSSTQEPLIHYSPRLLTEALFEVPRADSVEVEKVARRARQAVELWRRVQLARRLEILELLAANLESASEQFARQMAIEIGKPLAHGREEVGRAAANIRDVARRAAGVRSLAREPAGWVRRAPLGVVGVVSAWNNPVAIPLGKIAPALAYGNAVVWKPAPAATRISQELLRLLIQAGAPQDAVGLLTGDHSTAQSLAENHHLDAITLTGSLTAGFALQEACARRMAPFQAELSGNNAAIVWDDADLPSAAAKIAWGAFAFAGQRCTANRRAIVPAARFEAFVEAVALATKQLRLGDPLDASVEIGPLISGAARDEHLRRIAAAEQAGEAHHIIRTHDGPEPPPDEGAYASPVLLGCDQPGSALVQEETMSPLLVIQRAEDFDHALALCNGVRHGLIASLFSGSAESQRRFLDRAQAGVLKLNQATAGVDVSLPFGGWKNSGVGPPEHGEGDAQFYTRMQAIYGAETGFDADGVG